MGMPPGSAAVPPLLFGLNVLECYKNLISFGFFLKCFGDISEEACDADSIYMVLQNQRWGKIFE
jgi:hypothetical protein